MNRTEDMIGSAVSIPINMIYELADLLISKKLISQQEMCSILQHLIDGYQFSDENHEAMVKGILQAALAWFGGQKVIESDQ
jgi:hypothetical protein